MRASPEPAHIRAILAAFDPKLELVDATRSPHGLVNLVTILETSGGPLVLKVYDDEAGRWKPWKERTLHRHLRHLGIPAPQVLCVDDNRSVAPFTWALAERAPGQPWSMAFDTLGDDANVLLHRRLGHYLGLLHATTFPMFGEARDNDGELVAGPVHALGGRGPFATWPDMHRDIAAARLRRMEGTSFADLIPPVEDFFARNAHLVAGTIVPRLLHGDLHRGNVLVEGDRITAILDLEESIVGHNEEDLMRAELAMFRDDSPEFERAFMDAYREHIALDHGYERRKGYYEVSRALVWIGSLISHGDAYAGGAPSQGGEAARSRLTELLRAG